ncbi:hypothetical protein I553_3710 [Mycobacterium xenopi 4042]|uniref:Uncharacterized protein n=1 Tax=Mycobacterium xenopi 4042 TaxID=1299334 RepID=X7YS46_MYCXE|nr:hypothetical protein I553_3710 [Mycobacterium xenopi 4042]
MDLAGVPRHHHPGPADPHQRRNPDRGPGALPHHHPAVDAPVSRLGPLYGVQQAMWRQFRVGYVPPLAPIPWAPLADHDPAIAFGPTGPMIGFVVGPREKATAHLPLAGP